MKSCDSAIAAATVGVPVHLRGWDVIEGESDGINTHHEEIQELYNSYTTQLSDIQRVGKKYQLAKQTLIGVKKEVGGMNDTFERILEFQAAEQGKKLSELSGKLSLTKEKLQEITEYALVIIAEAKEKLSDGEELDGNHLILEQALQQPTVMPKPTKAVQDNAYISKDTIQLNMNLTQLSACLVETMTRALEPKSVMDIDSFRKNLLKKREELTSLQKQLELLVRPIEKKLLMIESQVADYKSKKIPAGDIDSIALFQRTDAVSVLEELKRRKELNKERKERHDQLAEAYSHALILMEQVSAQLYAAEVFANISHDAKELSTALSVIEGDIENLKLQTRESLTKETFETEKKNLTIALQAIKEKYNAAAEVGVGCREAAEKAIKELSKMIAANGQELTTKLEGLRVYDADKKANILKTCAKKVALAKSELVNAHSLLDVTWKTDVKFLGAQDTQTSLAYEIDRANYAIESTKGSFPWDKTYHLTWWAEKVVYSPFEKKPEVLDAVEDDEETPAEAGGPIATASPSGKEEAQDES